MKTLASCQYFQVISELTKRNRCFGGYVLNITISRLLNIVINASARGRAVFRHIVGHCSSQQIAYIENRYLYSL